MTTILIIAIAFLALVALMILHELGHFFLARKFGVRVDEFGLGYPPRIVGKKIGETIYSLNLLPFGAFVRIYGQEDRAQGPGSFNQKPFWQKAMIILGGVLSFWLIAIILLSFVMALGVPTIIEDEDTGYANPKVQIVQVLPNSPAAEAGISIGDVLVKASAPDSQVITDKVKEFQSFTSDHKGQEIQITLQRGNSIFDVSVTPRASPPANEGPLGVALARTAIKSFPWYLAPIEGAKATWNLTVGTVEGWGIVIGRLIKGEPTGATLMGPVGIFGLFAQVTQLGVNYFLQFFAVIAIYMALFNILPIPVTDGGKLLFLVIEKIRKRPMALKLEQKIEVAFFLLLISLMIWVTIKDISRLF